VIVDRLHWSGAAYGRTYRSQPDLTAHEWRAIELAALSRKTQVVLMTDDPDAIAARWADTEMFRPEPLAALCERFDELHDGRADPPSRLPSIRVTLPYLVDPDGGPTPALLGLLAHAQAHADAAAMLLPASLGTGWTGGRGFMVLAEAPSDFHGPSLDPQLPMDRGPAAKLFWRALDQAGIKWWNGYYTSPSVFRSPLEFAGYVNVHIRPHLLLALGDPAQDLVARAQREGLLEPDVQVVDAHHPMYIRQFRPHLEDDWCTEVGAALGTYAAKEAVPCPA
jgi:hypothetical protein